MQAQTLNQALTAFITKTSSRQVHRMSRRLALLVVLAVAATAAAQPNPRVGFANRTFHPTAVRNWRGAEARELHCVIWYPAVNSAIETPQIIGPPDAPLFEAGSAMPHAEFAPSLAKLPLIVLSHGTGGSAMQMAWLGTALARAGFIAVAVDHPGNNGTASYTAEGFVLWWERATDLSEVIDGILADADIGSHVDPTRIGAAGFSLGGYTVLELAGAQTDVGVLYSMCHQHPDLPTCHVPEMRDFGSPDEILATVRKSSAESLARSADSFLDKRVKAVFAIAPALSFTQTTDSLRAIRIPVEIAVGAADPIAPPKDNADYLRANIHGARETTLPGNAAHYNFLDTCTAAGKARLPILCTDGPGVDRDAIHTQVANLAATFFNHALKIGKSK
jgi:predicted dienelactone hydrolase